jgi:hypothetical protein
VLAKLGAVRNLLSAVSAVHFQLPSRQIPVRAAL